MDVMKHTRTAPNGDRLFTTGEVADLCAYKPAAIRKLARNGTLDPVQLHPRGQLRFRRSDVERLIARDNKEE